VLAAVQGIEVGDAVEPEDNGLAVEHEALLPDLACGLDNPGIVGRPSCGRLG
jgi:hypothetical protein